MTSTTRSMPSFFSPEVAEDPAAFYRMLRAEDPVHYDPDLGGYLLTLRDDVYTAYRDPVFSSRSYEQFTEPIWGRSLLQMDGREHARKRALVTPFFRGNALDAWMPVIARTVNELLDGAAQRAALQAAANLSAGQTVDLVSTFCNYMPVFIIADILDLPHSDYSKFHSWYRAHTDFIGAFGKDADADRRGREATAQMWDYLTPIIAERRKNPGNDLISALITAEVDGEKLTDEEVRTHVTQLINAGSETTGKALASMLALLLRERDLFEWVKEDRTRVTAAISETLRYVPPSQMNSRQVTEDVEMSGTVIPAGSLAVLVIASANRDEAHFERPDVFDPKRTDVNHEKVFSNTGEHFAFGAGRHYCLGAMLAKAELTVGAEILMDRFPDIKLADDYEPTWHGVKARAISSFIVDL